MQNCKNFVQHGTLKLIPQSKPKECINSQIPSTATIQDTFCIMVSTSLLYMYVQIFDGRKSHK